MSALAFVGVVLAFWLVCTIVVIRMFSQPSPYPSEAAEVPEQERGEEYERARPLTEVGPLVVAGSDLDLTEDRVNLIFATLTLPYADDAEEYARGVVGLYVSPEVER